MAKLNDIRALAESHAAEISRSTKTWTGYLDTAATLYRYDFPETLLIHAQRPEATACAELEIWNSRIVFLYFWCMIIHVDRNKRTERLFITSIWHFFCYVKCPKMYINTYGGDENAQKKKRGRIFYQHTTKRVLLC